MYKSKFHGIIGIKLILINLNLLHSKKCWGVLTQIRVKHGQTQMLG